ncbi:alanine racemase, partial [Pseudomonas qingdaonensis]
MPFRRTLLAASLALLITGQAPLYAAPPLSMDNGTNALTVQNSNAWVEVSASALQHNIRTLQAELAGKSKLCAVLKADAYGHGIGLVMPSIIAQGVPCVAVASNEEAR